MSDIETEESDKVPINGLALQVGNRIFGIPKEIIEHIVRFMTTAETRKNFADVCQQWKILLRNQGWLKILKRFNPEELPGLDSDYFCSCNAFDRNLIKNPSGVHGPMFWDSTYPLNLWNYWESIPNPLVSGPAFFQIGSVSSCFAVHFPSNKFQTIYVLNEGLLPIVMDKLQPKIYVSEWYGSAPGVKFSYNLGVVLANAQHKPIKEYYRLHTEVEGGNWFKAEHTFENYGPGVREIHFGHGGRENNVRRRANGCRMTKATVKILFEFSGLKGSGEKIGQNIVLERNENDQSAFMSFPIAISVYQYYQELEQNNFQNYNNQNNN